MDDVISIILVVILAIGGLMMITAILTCYVRVFRDLCCRPEHRLKRRRQQDQQRECDPNRGRSDVIPMNDITQGESMPTESEKV